MYCDHNVDMIPSRDTLQPGMCPVKWALESATIARDNNCGKSVMCRDGMMQLVQILSDLTTGNPEDDDIDLVREICQVITTTPGCEISIKAAENILWSLENNTLEWMAHKRKRCAAGICYEAPAGVGAAAPGEGRQRRRRRGGGSSEE